MSSALLTHTHAACHHRPDPVDSDCEDDEDEQMHPLASTPDASMVGTPNAGPSELLSTRTDSALVAHSILDGGAT